MVDLSNLSINGKLPKTATFSLLTNLSFLNLSHNLLSGSIPYDISNCTQLSVLDLSDNNFTSLLSPIGFSLLSKLQILHLNSNNFTHPLSPLFPPNCAHLQSINLSSNHFSQPLDSIIPWHLCTKLQFLDLSHNRFQGPIPLIFPKLPSLHTLILSTNGFNQSIPDAFCSSSLSLQNLDLSENHLAGPFPLSLTNCSSLLYLDLSHNNITGNIPPQLGNCSSLDSLNLSENLFFGSLPPELGRLSKLQALMCGSNGLTGPIPLELSRCTSLTLLDLNTNHFNGKLPDILFGDLISLQHLVLHSNAFSGPIPETVSMLSNLEFLDLSNNSFSGSIPRQLGNLSSLQFLMVAANNITGGIPSELGSIDALQFLDISSNHLTGSIPSSLGKLQRLLWLMLAYNNLTGSVPQELGNCTSLLWLNLRSNSLSGELPTELASMGRDPHKTFESNAKNFDPPKSLGECLMMRRWVPESYPPYSFVYDILDRNRCVSLWREILKGTPLPPACKGNTKLGGYIQVTNNRLTGSIPEHLQSNQSVMLLLGSNFFTGSLPGSLGKPPLFALNVSHNHLSGSIPAALGNDNCLTLLDLSFNNLSGSLPQSLGHLNQLSRFDVSYNPYLNGSVPFVGQFLTFNPASFMKGTLLCLDSIPGMRVRNLSFSRYLCVKKSASKSSTLPLAVASEERKKVSFYSFLAMGAAIFAGVFLCSTMGLYVAWTWAVRVGKTGFPFLQKTVEDDRSNREYLHTTMCMFNGGACSPPIAQLTYAEIVNATDNFDESNVLGCGGFGIVYKAKLPDGYTVAIKKLAENGPQGDREFIAEMETLSNHANENLVPLLGCCIFGSEKLLVYKFLCNGSLDEWLHEKEGGAQVLNWPRRLKIACGCAKGLRYLHHNCSPVLIHRDMKASNILLDEDFNGYVTDFGFARELHPGYTHVSTTIAGTLGYVPPEYCQTWRATTKGDVYSFGVVLLELITGRHPLCWSENNDGNLVEWVRSQVSTGRAAETIHEVVKETDGRNASELFTFLELANACTRELPEQRPTMEEVASILEILLGDDP